MKEYEIGNDTKMQLNTLINNLQSKAFSNNNNSYNDEFINSKVKSLDINVFKDGCILRSAVIFFYISNEGISLLENATHLGLPVPEKLKEVLEQLHDREEKEDDKS